MAYLSFIAALAVATGGAGAYFGMLSPAASFFLCVGGVGFLALNLPLSLISFIRFGRREFSLAAFLFGLISAAALGFLLRLAIENPVRDVTTQLGNPPRFTLPVAAIKAPGMQAFVDPSFEINRDFEAESAEKQKAAYPDIRPLLLSAPPASAYQMAMQLVKNKHPDWIVREEKAGELHAELEVKPFPFLPLVDDVVIQAAPVEAGTALQIRSRGRYLPLDFGTNARRVREFVSEIKANAAAMTPPMGVMGATP